MRNSKQFKELIARYESITIKEIEEDINNNIDDGYLYLTAKRLTGFGSEDTCSLCNVIISCNECIYPVISDENCVSGKNKKTYINISNAETPHSLLDAYKARAEHMKNILKR